MAAYPGLKHRSRLPPTQRRIYDFDNDIGLIFDLGDRTVLNRYFVGLLEDHGSHRILWHCCLFLVLALLIPSRQLLTWRVNGKDMLKLYPFQWSNWVPLPHIFDPAVWPRKSIAEALCDAPKHVERPQCTYQEWMLVEESTMFDLSSLCCRNASYFCNSKSSKDSSGIFIVLASPEHLGRRRIPFHAYANIHHNHIAHNQV